MAYQLFIGLIGEGPTDSRFLKEIIEKTFIEQARYCHTDVVIEGVQDVHIGPSKGTFVDKMLKAARQCQDMFVNVLCIHADADSPTSDHVMTHKFTPFQAALAAEPPDTHCLCIPLIPVQMTEAWMLANKHILQTRIGAATLSQTTLGIDRLPETYADPKSAIKTAIQTAQRHRTRRHRHDLTLNDLYEEMGQLTDLTSLRTLPSFQNFERDVREAMRYLGLMA
ncbi:MAG: DUF4276 family protein [Bacteroidia bacterium]|nr:DUF4276 family protein [Bacteroidia bacterium]